MKIRNGFVSNSSSSSFIVEDRKLLQYKTLLSKEQIALLESYGFKRTHYQPHHIQAEGEIAEDTSGRNYGYHVLCNEDEVINFLFEHKIPFKALLHYGHEAMIYDGGDTYYHIPNLGNRALTYGVGTFPFEQDKYDSFLCNVKEGY